MGTGERERRIVAGLVRVGWTLAPARISTAWNFLFEWCAGLDCSFCPFLLSLSRLECSAHKRIQILKNYEILISQGFVLFFSECMKTSTQLLYHDLFWKSPSLSLQCIEESVIAALTWHLCVHAWGPIDWFPAHLFILYLLQNACMHCSFTIRCRLVCIGVSLRAIAS